MGEQSGTQSHSALRIVAACPTTAEFVAAYSRFCEGRSLFIATKSPKPIGQIVKFKIVLASGEHLMTGVGPVVETFDDRENRFNRPGMRIEVEKLDASGRHWMEQLRSRNSGGAGALVPRVVSSSTGMFSTINDDSMPAAAPAPAPAVVSVSTGMFTIVSDESRPVVSEPVVAAVTPPVVPAAAPAASAKQPGAVPVAIDDGLSAGWDVDGLAGPLTLPRPRGATAPPVTEKMAAGKNGEKAGGKNGEKPQQAVVASGELDLPLPLPPPPNKARSKRITFPALMFKKPGALATPTASGAVVPKPIALLPAATTREGKLRPPPSPAEREPGAPVAPLGTPADTEPHVMVPRELESSLARSHAPADGTPPPAPEPTAEMHPDIADAPPEESGPVQAAATEPDGTPDVVRRRSKASTTTPPPVWAERTVTQTLHALVGGRPDPKVQEETVHWTNPAFAALVRPAPPEVDIVEEEVPEQAPSAVPVVVGVEITADVMDKTIISPPPVAVSRRRLVVGAIVTAAACLGGGYFLGLEQGLSASVEKLPVDEIAAAAPAPDKQTWVVECSEPDPTATAAAEPAPEPTASEPAPPPAAAVSPPVAARARPHDPAPPPPSSSQTCYLNAMSSPAGATVLIDTRPSGETPLRAKVACGRHTVKFEMPNYQAATRSVTLRRGETEKVSAELSRPRAVLRVESTPSGATVLINGSSVGVTPLTTTVAGFVTSTVTLSKPGFKTVSRPINPTTTSARIGATLKADAAAARRSSSRR